MKKPSSEEGLIPVVFKVDGTVLPLLWGGFYSSPDNMGLPVRLALINDMRVEVTCATAKHRL